MSNERKVAKHINMNHMKISTYQIANDADLIMKQVDAVPGLLKELETAMQELFSCWEGTAKTAYQQTFNESMEALGEVYDEMKTYADRIKKSAQIYHRAEQDVGSEIRKMIII